MRIEWLILADAAQIAGNKLYLLGGGWDVLTVNSGFPVQQRCAVALSIRVPWNETNQRHAVELLVEDEDGRALFKAGGEIEVGRPPGIPPGQDQRAQLAYDLALNFERPGSYVIRVRAEGLEERVVFRVVPGPVLMSKMWPGGPSPQPPR